MQVNSYKIELSSLDKIMFPEAGITKGDLIDYYHRIGKAMIPLISDRPASMHRFPDGISNSGFFQQEIPDYFPGWIERIKVKKKEGGSITHVVCGKTADLVYLTNQGCITLHTWLSRRGNLSNPDRMIYDLDPQDDDFNLVCQGALELREALSAVDLKPYVMTTGSRGLHVVVPLEGKQDFDTVRKFSRETTDKIALKNPEKFTTEQRKVKRRGRLYLDISRNAYGQTAVAPYAVRPIEGATVATPLEWEEIETGRIQTAREYNIKNIFRRLAQKEDPWKDMDKNAASISNLE